MAEPVVVIGGGATGCCVARDLALRGVPVTLVERGSINAGTTGRSHGLLHSGARYADVDPAAARECRAESRILRRIAGACVEDTGGYFVSLPGDSPEYAERKLRACRECDIDAEVVDGARAREAEPALSPDVERAIAVPDAVVYPSRLVAATAADASEHGARILDGAEVVDLRAEDGRVAGVEVESAGEPERLPAGHVVNAAGAWAGEVAALAGVDLPMAPTRGVMVTVEHRLGRVVNRCRPPADGDIAVPHGSTAVLGTTSEPVEDPDAVSGETAEIERVREECGAMLPGVADAPEVARFWGVRPLPASGDGGRDASRGHRVIDHAGDGAAGFTSVVGGKLTTCRLMAEDVADRVAAELGVGAACRTAEEPLPGVDDPDALDGYVRSFSAGAPADADVVGQSSRSSV